jgi:nicotinate-nucleotide adenylyltransferase
LLAGAASSSDPLLISQRRRQDREGSWDILRRMQERIGIFGGTFDPPHLGHLILASEAYAQLNLDRLLWVLTSIPPHKLDQAITPLDKRLAMLQLAIADEPRFEISRVDIDRPGPHYTSDTVKLLAAANPGAALVLLLGGDSLHDLPTWHQPTDLVLACDEIGVMRRPDARLDLSSLERAVPGVTQKVRFVDAPLLEIASHEIRKRAASGLPFRYYVPARVHDFIVEKGLYQGAVDKA